MFRHIFAIAVMAAGSGVALSHVIPSFSFDSSAPAGRVTVDIFVDLAPTDAWTAMGLRAVAMNGAALHYGGDPDANNPVPNYLIGPYAAGPVTDPYVTSLSRPRNPRDGEGRFNENADATLLGRYSPAGGLNTIAATAGELNVAWFSDQPVTAGSPSVDGYVARVALDFAQPAGTTLGVSETQFMPSGATVVLLSEGHPSRPDDLGLATASFDQPALVGFDWAVWYVPEPGSAVLLGFAGVLTAFTRRR